VPRIGQQRDQQPAAPAGQGLLDGPAVDREREASVQLDPDHDAQLQVFGRVGVNTFGSARAPEPAPRSPTIGAAVNQVTCECGFQTRDAQEGPVVTAVLDHVRSDHPDLQGSVTPEVVRGWIEIVPD